MNPLSDARVLSIVKYDNDTVEFVIDLMQYPHLSNPELISQCMNQYQFMYAPNVASWQAHVERGRLRIIVTGKIDWSKVS